MGEILEKGKKKLKMNQDKIIFGVIVILLVVLKHYLVCDFPIIANVALGEDDALMVNIANNIIDGKWLGDYKYNLLIKGPVFPKILATCFQLGIPYITAMTALYSFSCILFVWAIKDIVKNKYCLLGIFAFLLFNPIMYSSEIIQRVYRNALIPSFVLLMVGGFIGIYLRREKKPIYLLPWSIIAAGSLSLFYYTREDSIWIMPFLIFMEAVIGISLVIKIRKINLEMVLKILILIIPIVSLFFMGNYIACKNEKYYGIKMSNILKKSNFAEAMKVIYSVKPEEEIEYVTVTREKVARMAENSIMFATITPKLNDMIIGYDTFDTQPFNHEVADGWFFWALRYAVDQCDIKTLVDEERVYGQIADEISQALEDGRLEKQAIMPSPLISPWKKGNAVKLVKAIGKTVKFVTTCEDISISNTFESEYDISQYNDVKRFETLTNNRVIYAKDAVDLEGNSVEELKNQDKYMQSLSLRNSILNLLVKIYACVGVIFGFISVIAYIKLTIDMILGICQKKFEALEKWLIVSGILGALFSLVVGISYTYISAFHAINCLYLAGAYPLYYSFIAICITFILVNKGGKK